MKLPLFLICLQLLALNSLVAADYVDIEQVFFSKLTDYDETMLPEILDLNSKPTFLINSCEREL